MFNILYISKTNFLKMNTKPTTLKQQLSKDMKKQGHVTSKKPNNNKISSEESLADVPKKGTYREPNSKKIDGEKFLAKDHKLTHIKEFNSFNESQSLLTHEEKKWLESIVDYTDNYTGFEPNDKKMRDSIFSKLGIGTNSDDKWELGSGY